MESRVAVWLAEGKSVRDIAPGDETHGRRHLLAPEADLPEITGLPAVDLVRLVLSSAEFG